MDGDEAITKLVSMGARLAADLERNDHWTSHPQFTVQRKRRVSGFDTDYASDIMWIDIDNDHREVRPAKARVLESRFGRGDHVPNGYIRTGYRDEWEFVDVYVTYEAAKARVEAMNQRGGDEYRTYVESGYRNKEWQTLREALIALSTELESKP